MLYKERLCSYSECFSFSSVQQSSTSPFTTTLAEQEHHSTSIIFPFPTKANRIQSPEIRMCCSAKKQRRAQAQAELMAANAILYNNDNKANHNSSAKFETPLINTNPPSYNAVMNNNDLLSTQATNTITDFNKLPEKSYNTFNNNTMTQNICSSAGQCCGGSCGMSTCSHQSCGGRGGCRSSSNTGCGMARTGGCGARYGRGCCSGYGGSRCASGVVVKLIKNMIEAKREKNALRKVGPY